jgi:arabinofuranan 3-O-arabinosyltransferase
MTVAAPTGPAAAPAAAPPPDDPPAAAPAPPGLTPSVWRLRLAAVCVGLVLLAMAQNAGAVAADTKLDLVVDPGRLLGRALHLWDALGYFGQLQNQGYGYLFPMGPFFVAGDWLALPPWVVQRLWHAALLVAAFLGVVRLAGRLGVGSPWTRVLAGLAYALAPRVLTVLGAISAEAMPAAVAPWVLLPLVGGAALAAPRRAAARSGVALLFAGGVNAAATLAILPLPAWWLLTRRPGPARRRLAAWWTVAVAAACAWWLLPLLVLGRYSPPFLDWIESASVTTSVTTLLDVLRGTSHWVTRVTGAGGAEWPAGFVLTVEPVAVLATGGLALLGLLGLARSDLPHRRFLAGALLIGVALVTAGHLGPGAGLGAGAVRSLLDGPLAPFRNVHKFDPVVRLPLVLGVAHLLASARLPTAALPARLPLPPAVRLLVPALAVGLLAVTAGPALAGRLVPSPRGVTEAAYWPEVAGWLGDRPQTGRALVVPGAPFAAYVWGRTGDDAMQPLATTPWGVRDAVPLSPAGTIRLLDAIGARLDAGRGSPGLAAALARSGVGVVVVRNDLDPARAGSTPAELVHEALDSSPGLVRAATFGPPLRQPSGVSYPAVEVYDVLGAGAGAGPVARLPVAGALRTSGGPEDVLDLADRGLLGDRALLLAGDDAGPDVSTTPVLSDSYRRREVGFSAVRGGTSATLAADEGYRLDRPTHDYVPAGSGPPTAARLLGGLAAVTASSAGSDVDALLARSPAHLPFAAVDGDPSTSWVSGSFTGAVGQWLELRLAQPALLSEVQLAFTGESFVGPLPTRLVVETDAGRGEVTVSPDPLVQTVATPVGRTRRLRITVAAVDGGGSGFATGLATLVVPRLFPTRTLDVPEPPGSDPPVLALGVADGAHPACVGTRGVPLCAPAREQQGEEDVALDRTVRLAGDDSFRLAATVRPRSGAGLDALLAPPGDALRATASGRLGPDPRTGPGAAVDGDADTGWIAPAGQPGPELRLSWTGARAVDGIRLRPLRSGPVGTADQVTVVGRVGSRLVGSREAVVDAAGIASFPALRADRLTVRVEAVRARSGGGAPGPVAVAEAAVLGPAGELAAGVDPAGTVLVPCGRGPVLEIDGRPVRTRVAGSRAAWLAGTALPAVPCGTDLLRLRPGEHRLRVAATATTRPQDLTLVPAAGLPATGPMPPGALVVRWGPTERAVRVPAERAASYLVVRENANAGWRATLGGAELRPVRLDGWQQGWLVPAGAGGEVRLTFAPDAGYRGGLLAGGLLALLLVGAAVGRGGPGRSRPAGGDHRSPPDAHRALAWTALPAPGGRAVLAPLTTGVPPPRRASWAVPAVLLLAALAATGVVLPLAAGAAAAVLLLARVAPAAARLLPAALVVAGAGVALALGTARPVGGPDPLAGGWVAQVGCAVALAGVAGPLLPDRRGERTRASSGRSTSR